MSEKEQVPNHADEFVPEDDRVIGVAFRWSLAVIAVVAAVVVAFVLLGREDTEPEPEVIERGAIEAPAPLPVVTPAMPVVRFTDITESSGIAFRHESGARGDKLLPETMGSGAAFFDLEGDGDQDLLLVNGAPWTAEGFGAAASDATLALYENDGTGSFRDVTRAAGLAVSLRGTGVAVADVEGDGDPDLFIAAVGNDRFFRNEGGVFRDVTDEVGLAGDRSAWTTSAGFFDMDGDGDLDLFACHYIQWSREIDFELNFTLNGRDRAYGPPNQYQGTFSALYRNDGDRFTDVSEESGIQVRNPATGAPMGKSLAVTFADADQDGHLDILVANDTVQNFLLRNRGDGTFEDLGARSGLAFDDAGMATGAMGIDAGEHANDGRLAVAIGNFANESTSLYVSQRRPGQFAEMSSAEGIGSPSRLKLSFGVFFFDYDLDGRLDLLQANGHLEDEINAFQPSQTYRQPAQLFWNCGPQARSCYRVVPENATGDLARPIVGRAAAYADVDGDGDVDVLLTQTGDRPLLLRNDQDLGHHWLRVRLVGRGANREAIGARVELAAGGVTQRRVVMPTRSYLSQVELPVTFGLGESATVDSLVVTWPDGTRQEVPVSAVDRVLVVEQAG